MDRSAGEREVGETELARPSPMRRSRSSASTAPVQLLSPLVTFGEPRFKMPIYPVLAVTAAVALVAVVRRGRWLEVPRPVPVAAAPGDPADHSSDRSAPEVGADAANQATADVS